VTGGEGVTGRVREILSQVLGVPTGSIGPGFSSDSAPEWTSLNHLMLVSQIESEFGVFFSTHEVQKLTSFDAIVAALKGQGGTGAGG
jgi:acyl carrier protein